MGRLGEEIITAREAQVYKELKGVIRDAVISTASELSSEAEVVMAEAEEGGKRGRLESPVVALETADLAHKPPS